MTNWYPGFNAMHEFYTAISSLTNTRIAIIQTDFPLTIDEVEAVTTPDSIRGHYEALRKAGIEAVKKTRWIGLQLSPEHGTSRRIAIKIFLPRPIYYSYDRQVEDIMIKGSVTGEGALPKCTLPFDPNVITSEKLNQLVRWAENATEEHRRAALTVEMVHRFIKLLATNDKVSLALMIGRWPALRVVCEHVKETSQQRYSWQQRVRDLPTNLNRWRWPAWGDQAQWRAKNDKAIYIAEETLLSAIDMVRPPHNPVLVTAEVLAWEKLNGQQI
jgi:hypothetical protein